MREGSVAHTAGLPPASLLLGVNGAAVATAFNTQDIARRLPLLTKMAEVTNPMHAAAAVMDVADDEISISCQPAKDLRGTELQYSVFTKETRGARHRGVGADSADYSASHPETYATGAYPPVGIPREGFSAAGGDRGGCVYNESHA